MSLRKHKRSSLTAVDNGFSFWVVEIIKLGPDELDHPVAMIDHVHKPELTHKPVAVDPTEIDLTSLMLTVDRKDRLVDDTLENHGDHRGILLTARDPRQTESKDPLERCAYEIPREGKDVDKGLVVDRQRLTAAQLNLVSTELTID